ncbi:hypothetical protein GX51_06333 [Blastomyces parvus]|uniref:Uncharacterized protein n=1 Tax=Blastomyces parvus TaxID=2060905 RepID=A0A2B7WS51_9EURO|nr:hypothetical protein GX51_06333 [Blastomyces parvus]
MLGKTGNNQVDVVSFDFLFHTVLEKTSNPEMGMKRYDAKPARKQHDIKLPTNLSGDLSRILLSLSQIPLQQLGSFIIDCNGFLRLANLPLSIETQQLENEKIPTNIPRDYTYSTVESYLMDMLAIHDSHLQNQPNAVNNLEDCASQMSALDVRKFVANKISDKKRYDHDLRMAFKGSNPN